MLTTKHPWLCVVCLKSVRDGDNNNYISIRDVASGPPDALVNISELRYHINCFNGIAGSKHSPRLSGMATGKPVTTYYENRDDYAREELNYIQKKLFESLQTPKEYLGYKKE